VAVTDSRLRSVVHCDIGHGCLVEARIDDTQASMYVHIGLGFHIEVPFSEAFEISNQRQGIIERKAGNLQEEIDAVVTDLEFVSDAIHLGLLFTSL
jgi:prefoldin subunit 5